MECHILWPQNELFELCKKLGITFTSFATIGSSGGQQIIKAMTPSEKDWPGVDCMGHPVVQQLAKKYGKSPAQVR